MPVVGVKSAALFAALGRTYTEKEFDQLCFDFGIELDAVDNEDDVEVYKIDIPANRYDLLCLEGLVCALRVFSGQDAAPVFSTVAPAAPELTKMVVRAETAQIRPFVVCAVLRGLSLDEGAYQSCLDLQDQLHRNLCRKRTLVAIGTHDLDAIQGPFTYEALAPKDIVFQNLFAKEPMDAKAQLDWFRSAPEVKHIKEYTDIIYDSPVYPVIYDANRTVLSLPPIINGSASKISTQTKNMFIECTATDMTKAKIVLNTVVAMFARYCATPNCVEQVQVEYDEPVLPGGETEPVRAMATPDLSTRPATAQVKRVCSTIGVELQGSDMTKLCERMQLGPASVSADGAEVTVTVPVTRSDVLHEVDIAEDIAIAYGYNNIVRTIPVSHGAGKELPVNLLSDLLRHEVSRQGYMECLTLGLSSLDENFAYMNHPDPGDEAVTLSNPKTREFQCVRTSLLPGILKTLAENKAEKFSEGVRLFEVSEVVLRDPKTPEQRDIGCRNERRLAAMHAGLVSDFAALHGLADRIMQVLAVVPAKEYSEEAWKAERVQRLIADEASIGEYKVVPSDDPAFMPGRGAALVWRPVKPKSKSGDAGDAGEAEFQQIGTLGVLHPTVLRNFAVPVPCTVLEMNIEPFVRH